MKLKIMLMVGLVLGSAALSACTPVVIGAGAAVVAHEVAERKHGGRGLF